VEEVYHMAFLHDSIGEAGYVHRTSSALAAGTSS
jgi:hypothetical protein